MKKWLQAGLAHTKMRPNEENNPTVLAEWMRRSKTHAISGKL